MRRTAVLLAVSLSAGIALARQDPAASDRAPIPATIETWYSIYQNKEQVGWFHEMLTTTTMRNYRYDYVVLSEYRYDTTNPNGEAVTYNISENLTAKLEEDFDIHELDYTQDYGFRLMVKLKTYPESEERVVNFELKTEPPQSREYKFLTSDTLHLYLNPMLYRLRQSGALAQPTRLRERVLHPGLEDPISVSYTAGAITPKEILGKRVKVSEVRIEGWDRGALAPFTHIWVDKYGRIVYAESADKSLTMTIMKDKADALPKGRQIALKGRKDPFSKIQAMDLAPDPSKRGPTTGGTRETRIQEAPKIDKTRVDAYLRESRELVAKLQDEMARGLLEEARGTYIKILLNYKGLYAVADLPHLTRNEVDKLKEDAERLYGGVKKLQGVMAGKVDRINDLYLNDNLEGIDREIVDLEAMRNAPELFRSEEGQAELETAIRAAKEKRSRTVARIELGKKSLTLTGTMTATEVVQEIVKLDLIVAGARLAVSQPVSVRRVVTWAVINDEPFREGEMIQREGVKIVKIHRHAVEVEYKGEVRQVVLRKS